MRYYAYCALTQDTPKSTRVAPDAYSQHRVSSALKAVEPRCHMSTEEGHTNQTGMGGGASEVSGGHSSWGDCWRANQGWLDAALENMASREITRSRKCSVDGVSAESSCYRDTCRTKQFSLGQRKLNLKVKKTWSWDNSPCETSPAPTTEPKPPDLFMTLELSGEHGRSVLECDHCLPSVFYKKFDMK